MDWVYARRIASGGALWPRLASSSWCMGWSDPPGPLMAASSELAGGGGISDRTCAWCTAADGEFSAPGMVEMSARSHSSAPSGSWSGAPPEKPGDECASEWCDTESGEMGDDSGSSNGIEWWK